MTRSSLARMLRTLRPLRFEQVWAQIAYVLKSPGVPVRVGEAAPELATEESAVPFLPAPAHVRGDGRRLELLNVEIDLGEPPDWDSAGASPLWRYHLHQFDWLRQPGISAQQRSALLLDWIRRHPRGVGWNPHPISLRILSWGKLLLSSGALALDDESHAALRLSLANQVETLARHPETRLQGNHLFSNWLGVVFAGLLFKGRQADRWLDANGRLRRELARQIDADGAHVERSPMYHSLLLENMLDLLNLVRSVPERAPEELVRDLEIHASKMLGALPVWTHPDGDIALFGDSARKIAQVPSALSAYASALGLSAVGPRRSGLLRAAGFVRLEDGPFTLLASLEGPMPRYQPGHAHCDALSFELSVDSERVVTDSGVAEYVPGPLRDASRATSSHATLEVGGEEQAEVWSAHRVGGRPTIHLGPIEPPHVAEATCTGWATRDSSHRRTFKVADGFVQIHDRLQGTPRSVQAALPLAPGLAPELGELDWGGAGLRVALTSGARLTVELPEGFTWSLDSSSVYMPEFGRSEERVCVVGRCDRFTEGTWKFWMDPGS